MASLQFDVSDDFARELEQLGKIDDVAPKMINAAAPVVVAEMKRRLSAHDATGELSKSVKASKPKYNAKKGGYSCAVNPTGKSKHYIGKDGAQHTRKEAVRNMEKMASLEFGNSNQKATPIVQRVISATENEVTQIMQNVYERELGL